MKQSRAALEKSLQASVSTVTSYAALRPAQRTGRPLLLAFAALQEHTAAVRSLAKLGHTDQPLPADIVDRINTAMGTVAAAVAALPSLSRSADLKPLRAALGLNTTLRDDRKRDRDAAILADSFVYLQNADYITDAALKELAKKHGCSISTARKALNPLDAVTQQIAVKKARGSLPVTQATTTAPKAKRTPNRTAAKAAINGLF